MRFIEVMLERLKQQYNKTMTPPSVEEQGETNELSRKEIPESTRTGGSEQERDKEITGREVCDIHNNSEHTEHNVSDSERTNDSI